MKSNEPREKRDWMSVFTMVRLTPGPTFQNSFYQMFDATFNIIWWDGPLILYNNMLTDTMYTVQYITNYKCDYCAVKSVAIGHCKCIIEQFMTCRWWVRYNTYISYKCLNLKANLTNSTSLCKTPFMWLKVIV